MLTLASSLNAATTPPNDPRYPEQWSLPLIGAPDAWKATTGNTNIVIAILDTGIDYNHPDLAKNMWRNPAESGLDANGMDKATNGIDDDQNGFIDDVFGADVFTKTGSLELSGDPMDQGILLPNSQILYHGTLCAGVIGAEGNNGLGVTGINWTTQMMAVRTSGGDVRDLQGHSDFPFYENIVAGLDYVLMMKRRGVNIRVASCSFLTAIPGDELHDVVEALGREGVICVFAAGNETFNLDENSVFPGCFNLTNVLVVANTDRTGALNAGSSFGKGTVDLAAPGTDILTTTKGGLYASVTGTSFSCPLVAGACALILSAHPDLGIEDLKAAVFGSVNTSTGLNGKMFTNGRLNVARALELLNQVNSLPIITSALPAGRPTPPNFPVQVTFNRPMDQVSVEESFSVTPAIPGIFQWSSDSQSFSYAHTVEFDLSTNYTVRVAATAKDKTGQTLDGNFNRVLEPAPADDFTWTFRFAIPGDNLHQDTIPLIGSSGTLRGDNRYATWQPGEIQPTEFGAQIRANTLWYTLGGLSVEGGWFTFDMTKGTIFDSIIEIFETKFHFPFVIGIAENDNYGSLQSSRLSLYIPPTAPASIRVSGKDAYLSSASGPFVLSWYPTPPPGFTGSQFSPLIAAPDAKITLTGTNLTGATAVLFNGASASFTNAAGNNFDLRITAVVPPGATTGPITIMTPHGNVTSATIFQVIRPSLTATRTSLNELTLTWQGSTFTLESSPDFRNWTQVTSPGSTTATVLLDEDHRFFRLRQ
jgi:hypothetical protein